MASATVSFQTDGGVIITVALAAGELPAQAALVSQIQSLTETMTEAAAQLVAVAPDPGQLATPAPVVPGA